MAVVEFAGAQLTYDEAGRRGDPVLVFIHAGVATRRMWDPQFDDLARDHHVIRYDTRGYGDSHAANGPYAEHADTLAVLDAAGVSRATLIGASRGGRIAIDTALTAPERVAGLVAVCSNVDGQPEGPYTERELEMIAEMERAEQEQDLEALVRLEVAFWDLGPTRDVDDVDPEFLATAIELNVGAAHWDFEGVAQKLDPPAFARLGELTIPLLAVIGDHDETHARAGHELMLTHVPRAEGYRFPDAAHLPSVEHPARFTAVLREFLATTGL